MAFWYLSGPLAVGIAKVIGTRPLVMAGGVIVFAGLLATSYANSVTELMFTVGVVTGKYHTADQSC